MMAQKSPWFYAWGRFLDNKASVGAGIFLLVLVAAALAAPLITVSSYEEQLFLEQSLAFPSAQHWLGWTTWGGTSFPYRLRHPGVLGVSGWSPP